MDDQNKNLILATVLSFLVILVWYTVFAPAPAPQDLAVPPPAASVEAPAAGAAPATAAAIPTQPDPATAPRLVIDTPRLSGSISLLGGTFDDLSLKDYILGLAEVLTHRRAWSVFMETYPLVLGPNSGDLPFEVGFDHDTVDRLRHVLRSQALMTAVNLLGLPSVAVPVGFVTVPDAPKGLPLGVQIVAGRYREDLALDAAGIVEAVHGIETPIDPAW